MRSSSPRFAFPLWFQRNENPFSTACTLSLSSAPRCTRRSIASTCSYTFVHVGSGSAPRSCMAVGFNFHERRRDSKVPRRTSTRAALVIGLERFGIQYMLEEPYEKSSRILPVSPVLRFSAATIMRHRIDLPAAPRVAPYSSTWTSPASWSARITSSDKKPAHPDGHIPARY